MRLVIELKGLTRTYTTPAGPFHALRDIDLRIDGGQMVGIVGRSGSGKSTLLHMLGAIDRPTRGEVIVDGQNVSTLRGRALSSWRGRRIGFVFQFFQLLPTLTAIENVLLPMDFAGELAARERRPRALSLLERMGVGAQADKLPSELSGGEQQRVAIARALANDPPVVLADEPTGNLDSTTGSAVFALFTELAREGRTVVVVTHERDAPFDRVVTLADGSVL
jgi:putative ABC transport system ATP-binding protein